MKTLTIALLATAVFQIRGVADELPDAQDMSTETLVSRSEWWPTRVQLVEDFTTTHDGEKIVLKKGRYAIFIRAEEAGALVDFGGFGVHVVPYEKTDVLAAITENSKTKTWETSGVLASQLSNKFFWPLTLEQTKVLSINGIDYFLITYLNVGSEISAKAEAVLTQEHAELIEAYPQLRFVTFPMDGTRAELLEDLKDSEITWPVMFHRFSEGYTQALSHQPTEPCAVLIDKNGMIISRLDRAVLENAPRTVAMITEAIDADTARRATFTN